MAEARARAAQLPPGGNGDALGYALVKERLRVLGTRAGEDPRMHYDGVDPDSPDAATAQVYGLAVAATRAGNPREAVRLLERLREAYPEVLMFHTALGEAQLAAGDNRAALDTLEHARELAPRNVPVTVRYGEALLRAGRPKRAHEVLLDLFNNVPPTPEQVRLTALAANSAGDVADAYSYMAEYHIMGGDLPLAINQLELALSVPNISSVQRARFGARLAELRQNLPKGRQRLQKSREHASPSRLATAAGGVSGW
jgi:predicted Zn-dependent protease